MFNIKEVKEILLQEMLEKAQRMVDKINSYPCVKSATLEGVDIKIVFNEEVDVEKQDLLGLFYRGGAIKKVTQEGKDKEYIKIDPIGEF